MRNTSRHEIDVKQPPNDRAEEEPRGKRDPVHPQAEADISPAECIGHDRRTVGDEERAAHALYHAVDHQIQAVILRLCKCAQQRPTVKMTKPRL